MSGVVTKSQPVIAMSCLTVPTNGCIHSSEKVMWGVVTGCLLCRMNVDQEVEIPVTTVETVITTTAEDVAIIEATVEEVCTRNTATVFFMMGAPANRVVKCSALLSDVFRISSKRDNVTSVARVVRRH